jgi:hypothetical protein
MERGKSGEKKRKETTFRSEVSTRYWERKAVKPEQDRRTAMVAKEEGFPLKKVRVSRMRLVLSARSMNFPRREKCHPLVVFNGRLAEPLEDDRETNDLSEKSFGVRLVGSGSLSRLHVEVDAVELEPHFLRKLVPDGSGIFTGQADTGCDRHRVHLGECDVVGGVLFD